MEAKRVGKTIRYTFSQEDLRKKLLPTLSNRTDIEILSRHKRPLTLSATGFSERELREFDWKKKFDAHKATAKTSIADLPISDEAKSKLKELQAETLEDLITTSNLPKLMREVNMSERTMQEIKGVAATWNEGISSLIRKRSQIA